MRDKHVLVTPLIAPPSYLPPPPHLCLDPLAREHATYLGLTLKIWGLGVRLEGLGFIGLDSITCKCLDLRGSGV